jgi:hypothetical protein
MPLAVPTSQVNEEEIGKTISPEDYTTLFKWATFTWVYPLIKKVLYFIPKGHGTHSSLGNDHSLK